uniref:Uncharacterized protein n=1 Tax=Rhizophora mucronata TaxID=61149 RepID=A0A2P2MFC0_RHIMU
MFPNHFRVPEALRSGLTFGSFTAKRSGGVKNDDANDVNPSHAIESSLGSDDTAGELVSSDEHGSSNGQVDHFDEPESPTELHEEVPQSDGNDALDADSKDGNLKKDVIFPQEGHQDAATQIAPTYGFGVMQPIHEGNLAQFDRLEAQTQDISCVSSFVVSFYFLFAPRIIHVASVCYVFFAYIANCIAIISFIFTIWNFIFLLLLCFIKLFFL